MCARARLRGCINVCLATVFWYALCGYLCASVRALDMHTHREGLIASAGASRGSSSSAREAEAGRDRGSAGSEGGSDCAVGESETVG